MVLISVGMGPIVNFPLGLSCLCVCRPQQVLHTSEESVEDPIAGSIGSGSPQAVSPFQDLVKGAGFPPFSQQCCQLSEENVLYRSLLFVVPGNVLITNNMLFLAPLGTQKKKGWRFLACFRLWFGVCSRALKAWSTSDPSRSFCLSTVCWGW